MTGIGVGGLGKLANEVAPLIKTFKNAKKGHVDKSNCKSCIPLDGDLQETFNNAICGYIKGNNYEGEPSRGYIDWSIDGVILAQPRREA